MNKVLATALFIIFTCYFSCAQHIALQTEPLRYIYGVNGSVSIFSKNLQQFKFLYQHHNRDFVSLRGYKDVLGFSAFPRLQTVSGYTAYVSYLFPLGESNFAVGPKVGSKFIQATRILTDEFSDPVNEVRRKQQNLYLLGEINWVNKRERFIFEMYLQAGLVHLTFDDDVYEVDGSFNYNKYDKGFVPHALIGFAIGWGSPF